MEPGFLNSLLTLLIANFVELCVFGIIMMLLQLWLPSWKGQQNWDKSSFLDIAYSFMLAFSTPFFSAVPIAMVDGLVSQIPELQALPGMIADSLSFPLQLLAAVVLIDLVSYWRHRIMHMKWLWPIHAIHHCSSRLNWLSTERFHVLNYVISSVLNSLVVLLMFGPEVALFGAVLRRFYNFFIHANLDIDYGFLGYVFVSPRFHHWHHSIDKQAADKNYCTFFSCIDLLFGTFYLPDKKVPAGHMGIENKIDENIVAQFLHPFKTWYGWLRPNPE